MANRQSPLSPLLRTALAGAACSMVACAATGQAPPSTAAVPAPPAFDSLRTRLVELVESRRLASVTVGVIEEGRTVWLESIGWADVASRVAATPATAYAVGSLSKSITGTLALALHAAGELDLDAPVNRYLAAPLALPDGSPWNATTRQALQMVAGIPHGWVSVVADAAAPGAEEVLLRHGAPIFPAGQLFEYSNFSIGLAEAVMERATGRAFAKLLRSRLAEPLGLGSLAVLNAPAGDGGVSTRHSGGLRPVSSRFLPEAAAGLRISGRDLISFAEIHMGQRPGPFPPEALDEIVRGSGEAPHGLGMGVIEVEGQGRVLITNGSIGGANSNLTMIPGRRVAAFVLTNTSSELADPLAMDVLEVIRPGFAAAFGKAVGVLTQQTPLDSSSDDAIAGTWSGRIVDPGAPEAWAEPVRLEIQHGVARLGVGDNRPAPVERAELGKAGELRISPGSAWALPALTGSADGAAIMQCVLLPVGGRLVGYALVQYARETTSYGKPVLLTLERSDRSAPPS